VLFVLAVVLAGSGVVAAAVHDDGSSTATSAVTTTVPAPSATTTTAPPDTTTTAAPVPTTTSTPASATTTTRRGATTTTTPRATTTTVAPAPGPTTTTAAAKPLCTAAQIEVTAATDQASYLPSQTVTVNSAIRNRSTTTCYYTGYNFGVAFFDKAGQAYGGQSLVSDVLEATPVAPGERITHSATWDHRQCPVAITCGALPAGSYSAKVTWVFPGGPYERTVPVILA
jgi:hypothetical protein